MPLTRQVDPEQESQRAHTKLLAKLIAKPPPNRAAVAHFQEIVEANILPLPKFHLHQTGVTPELAAKLVREHLTLDGNPALNLASFVHTNVDEQGLELCKENITKNLADSDEYPALIEIQQRCVSILSHLWHVSEGELGVGTATTGSSEAIMLGGLALKRRWEAKRKAAGKPYDKPNIIMGANAQVALEKFARYFDVEMRLLDIHAKDHFSFSMEDLRKNVDENTIGVFAILGSTYTGHYQDIVAINEVLDAYEKETGHYIPIHVDGASGAFVAPFTSPDLKWDFQIPRVHSINTSGHKFGLAPVGCGWIVWRDQQYLPENLLFTLSYLGGSEVSYTLNFSRPGHPIIYQYYILIRNGFDGFYSTHSVSLANSRVLSLFLEDTGFFDVLSDIHRPKGVYYSKSGVQTYDSLTELDGKDLSFYNDGLPVVSFKLTDEFRKEYPFIPQEAISYMLRDKGYIIPNYPLPPTEENNECLRVVINDNISLDLLDKLMEDIVRTVNTLISIGSNLESKDHPAILNAITAISKSGHAEEEHEGSWTDLKDANADNHSRC